MNQPPTWLSNNRYQKCLIFSRSKKINLKLTDRFLENLFLHKLTNHYKSCLLSHHIFAFHLKQEASQRAAKIRQIVLASQAFWNDIIDNLENKPSDFDQIDSGIRRIFESMDQSINFCANALNIEEPLVSIHATFLDQCLSRLL